MAEVSLKTFFIGEDTDENGGTSVTKWNSIDHNLLLLASTMVINESSAFDNGTTFATPVLLEDDEFFEAIDRVNGQQQAKERWFKAQILELEIGLKESRLAHRKRVSSLHQQFGSRGYVATSQKKLTRKEKHLIRKKVKIWSLTDPQSGICSKST